jgi:hypothetical protein
MGSLIIIYSTIISCIRKNRNSYKWVCDTIFSDFTNLSLSFFCNLSS